MTRPIALITGITGQDGAYLAQNLLKKGYEVHGIRRRVSVFNSQRIDMLLEDSALKERFCLHYADMTDMASLIRVLEIVRPTEVYNLAAQSHVHVSFDNPEYTANVDGLGSLRLLESVRILGLVDSCRIYQASTSELYGLVQSPVQNESTPFYPRSPYGVAKLYAYWITVNYREAYGMFASNGILFNHESPIRGETFVTRKIARAVARIAAGQQSHLELGNLDSKRDWGHAADYVEGMWRILNHHSAGDFVLATGEVHAVRELVTKCFNEVNIRVNWRGKGVEEVGVADGFDSPIVRINAKYFRPSEVDFLQGDAAKARRELGWEPSTTFDELVAEMMQSEVELLRRNQRL